MTGPSVRAAAMAAAARGWRVFPLVAGTKRPAISAWETAASTDRARIDRWWPEQSTRPRNLAVACGPSGLVVLDLDTPAGQGRPDPAADRDPQGAERVDGQATLAGLAELIGVSVPTDTFTVATPHGRHLYFAAPRGIRFRNTAGRLGPHVIWGQPRCVQVTSLGSSEVCESRATARCRLGGGPMIDGSASNRRPASRRP